MNAKNLKARTEMAPFRTVVMNVYHGTPVRRTALDVEDCLNWGVQLFFVNEAKGRARTEMFNEYGLDTVVHDQFRMAWDPNRFDLQDHWHARLSEQQYFAKDGKTPVFSQGQAALLFDKEVQRTLECWSYHTPAHIQGDQTANGYPMRRYLAFIESMLYLADRADDTDADGFMAAGDDNWDEDGKDNQGGGFQTMDVGPIMLGRATGLRQVQGGEPTFGPREIDDYRILRLKNGGTIKPTGLVEVRNSRAAEKPAHRLHLREWVHVVRENTCPTCGQVVP